MTSCVPMVRRQPVSLALTSHSSSIVAVDRVVPKVTAVKESGLVALTFHIVKGECWPCAAFPRPRSLDVCWIGEWQSKPKVHDQLFRYWARHIICHSYRILHAAFYNIYYRRLFWTIYYDNNILMHWLYNTVHPRLSEPQLSESSLIRTQQ